jgi:putative membrane protein
MEAFMKKYFAAVAVLTCITASAYAQTPQPVAPVLVTTNPVQFRQMTVISDTFEIESSRLAMTRARSTAVRRFAAQMVRDHSLTSAELGVTPNAPIIMASDVAPLLPFWRASWLAAGPFASADSPMLDGRRSAMLSQLQAASGADFDRLYVDMQVMAHQEAVTQFDAFARSGADPAMRDFAARHLPHLQMHLARAMELDRRTR